MLKQCHLRSFAKELAVERQAEAGRNEFRNGTSDERFDGAK